MTDRPSTIPPPDMLTAAQLSEANDKRRQWLQAAIKMDAENIDNIKKRIAERKEELRLLPYAPRKRKETPGSKFADKVIAKEEAAK